MRSRKKRRLLEELSFHIPCLLSHFLSHCRISIITDLHAAHPKTAKPITEISPLEHRGVPAINGLLFYFGIFQLGDHQECFRLRTRAKFKALLVPLSTHNFTRVRFSLAGGSISPLVGDVDELRCCLLEPDVGVWLSGEHLCWRRG